MTTFKVWFRHHFANQNSHHWRIAIGFVWVSFFVFVGKLAGAAKEVAIAWRYGASETVDAYVFIFNLVNWPISVWFSVLMVILIPLVAKIRREKKNDLSRFQSELFGLTLLGGSLICLFLYWGMPLLIDANWVGFSDEVKLQALEMIGPLSFLVPIGFVISLSSAWMMACGWHRNTLLEAVPALVILSILLLPYGIISKPLVWGTVIGFGLQLVCLVVPLKKMEELQAPTLGFTSSAWRSFWGSMGIMLIGQSLMSLTSIIDQFFAARLDVGAIATLSYAGRIMALVLGLGAMAISRATLPVFSNIAAKEGEGSVHNLAIRWAAVFFLIGSFVAIIAWLSAPWLVAIMYERGAFSADDTENVSRVLKYLSIQIPFYFSGIVLVSALSSYRYYTDIAFISFFALLAKLLFLFIISQQVTLEALASSHAIMYGTSLLLCLMSLMRVRKNHATR